MADIVSGLFGVSPAQIRQQKQQQLQQEAMLFAQNPQAAEYMAGATVANTAASLFGYQDPELKRATELERTLADVQNEIGPEGFSDPSVLYPTLANKLKERGFGREAAMVMMQGQELINKGRLEAATLAEKQTASQLNVAKTVKELQPELTNIERLINAKDRLDPSNPNRALIEGQINKEISGSLPSIEQRMVELSTKRASGNISAQESQELDYLDNFKTKVAKAGAANTIVSQGGSSTIDVGRIEDSFKTLVGPKAEQLADIRKAVVVANQALSGSPTANEQLNTAIVTLYQSGRLSNQDIERVTNAGSLPQKIANGISKLAVGVDADITLEDKIKFIKAMEKLYAEENNKAVDKFENVWKTTPIGENTLKAYTEGSRYKLNPDKSKVTTTKSGTKYQILED